MYLRILATSVLALGLASSAFAEPLSLTVTPNGSRVVTVYTSTQARSEDAILPNGVLNVDQKLTGTTNRTPIRIQCDSSPTTSIMRTNTFDAPPNSDCP